MILLDIWNGKKKTEQNGIEIELFTYFILINKKKTRDKKMKIGKKK